MRMSYKQALGLGSSVIQDIGENKKERKKKEYEGYCTSYKCCRISDTKNKDLKDTSRIMKTMNTKKTWCPDCGCALYWEEKGEK